MRRHWKIPFFILAGCLLLPAIPARAQLGASPAGSATYAPGTGNLGTSPAASQTQGSFAGSVPTKLEPGVLPLSLQDAINRGLKQNLGLLLTNQDIRSARGERWTQLSSLLPHVSASPYIAVSQIDLAELGFNFPPGSGIPSVIGPYSYFDARAYMTQTLFDWKSINKTRSASQSLDSAQYTYKDARDLVVLAVGFSYLQAVAGAARIETAAAQVQTAQALDDQARDQLKAGTSPAIDALRSKVELQLRQQQLIVAKNNFAIQKLTLARVIGLQPAQEFDLTDKSLYAPLEGISVDEALKRAYASRSDLQAALANERAAAYSRKAAVGGYIPSLSFNANYGAAGLHPSTDSHGVMDVRGTLTIPIFQGGSVHGDVLKADAQLEQTREHVENLRAQIETDVRTALLNLESSAQQVAVAQSNIALAADTLTQSRDRFAAGVTDTVEVVQAQEAVASANENYISSLYSYNYAKISLARALGLAEEGVKEYFKGK